MAIALEEDAPPVSADVTLALEAKLVHSRTGIIKFLGTPEREDGEVDLPFFSAVASGRTPARIAGDPRARGARDHVGTGIAGDARLARVRAIGEAIERYALATTGHLRFVHSSWRDLEATAVHPDELALVSAEERARFRALRSFRDDEVVAWRTAADLTSGENVAVPARFVHRSLPTPPEQFWTPLFPSGSACANSLLDAVTRAMGEAIERDSLMMFWARKRPVPRVRAESIRSPGFHTIRDAVESTGRRMEAFDMTTDLGYPAYFVTITSEGSAGPALAMGTGAGFDAEAAVLRAAEEAVHMRARYRLLHRQSGGRIRLEETPSFFWWDESALKSAQFFLRSSRDVELQHHTPPASTRRRFDALLEIFKKRGLRVLAVDATPPDVSALGLRVAAVLTPGLLPKTSVAGLWHARTPRLWHAIPGDASAPPRGYGDLSDLPIPYP